MSKILTRTPDGFFMLQLWFLQIVRFPENMLRYIFTSKEFKSGIFKFIGIGIGHYYFGLFIAGVRQRDEPVSQIE